MLPNVRHNGTLGCALGKQSLCKVFGVQRPHPLVFFRSLDLGGRTILWNLPEGRCREFSLSCSTHSSSSICLQNLCAPFLLFYFFFKKKKSWFRYLAWDTRLSFLAKKPSLSFKKFLLLPNHLRLNWRRNQGRLNDCNLHPIKKIGFTYFLCGSYRNSSNFEGMWT